MVVVGIEETDGVWWNQDSRWWREILSGCENSRGVVVIKWNQGVAGWVFNLVSAIRYLTSCGIGFVTDMPSDFR